MKIKILKDCTVDVVSPDNGTYDKFIRNNYEIDCSEIIPLSKGFSNIVMDDGSVLVDLRNDLFVEMVCPDQDPS